MEIFPMIVILSFYILHKQCPEKTYNDFPLSLNLVPDHLEKRRFSEANITLRMTHTLKSPEIH